MSTNQQLEKPMPSDPPSLHPPLRLAQPRPATAVQPHQDLLSILGASPRSILHRNRSLKRFFQQKSVMREARQICQVDRPHEGSKNTGKNSGHTEKPSVGYRQRTEKDLGESEYLIAHRVKKVRPPETERKPQRVEVGEPYGYPRGSQRQQTSRTQEEINRSSTGAAFYDPNIYNWRKSHSKDRPPKQQPARPVREIKMVQSEYYETNNTTPQEISKKVAEEGDGGRGRGSQVKASSSGKELKRDSVLRPKVSKNVFSPRGRGSKQLSLSPKKSLLFTFGI